MGIITEIAQDQFAATNITQALSSSGHQGGVKFLLVLSALGYPRVYRIAYIT